jgi:hypothetical protein
MEADEEVPMTVIDFEPPPVTDDRPADVPTPQPAALTGTTVTPTVGEPPPAAQPAPDGRRMFADLARPLSRSWGFALVAAWVVVIAVGLAVEPPPADPDAPVPLLADLLSMGLLTSWGAMAAGVIQRRRFAGAASLVGGVGLLALTVGCPLSGHHAGIGAWWGVQIVGALALLALSAKALRSS